MWSNFYQNGGWGMWPTTLFGFFLVASCVLLMLRPEKRFVPLVARLGVLTFASGLLGTSVGFIKTFRYVAETVPREEQLEIALIGVSESLNNLVLALLIIAISMLLATIGAARVLRKG